MWTKFASRMGNQVSSIKTAAGKLAFEPRKKGTKLKKEKIGILAFEAANVMSKAVQLWQSLSDQAILRLCTEVIKCEGVLHLVSDNESVLLSLASLEKLQDLTGVASAVARLGRRCQEPALQGFEHVYNDILERNIDVRELQFPLKEMEAKIKKMESYIAATSNLYQELEVLSEMEQALRRAQNEEDAAQKDNSYALELKVAWQRHEVKYLKDISLWNRTYDKIVGLLARTVCTTYGRIIRVFGFPMTRWPQILSAPKNGESPQSSLLVGTRSLEFGAPLLGSQAFSQVASSYKSDSVAVLSPNGSGGPNFGQSGRNGAFVVSQNVAQEGYRHLSLCFSPGRQEKKLNARVEATVAGSCASYQLDPLENSCSFHSDKDQGLTGTVRGAQVANLPLPQDSAITAPVSGQTCRFSVSSMYEGKDKLLFDPKSRLQNAPPSTLGGAALALHYANVITVLEKMVRYPCLINPDARDDLYQMLPKNVRMALRGRLRPCVRGATYPKCDEILARDWKKVLERILGWLAPLAHNMIRWQSEHNFEQQQVVSRTNILLLQTLHFADQLKTEQAITELLIGLNYLWRYERELKTNALMEYAHSRDLNEYLEWQL